MSTSAGTTPLCAHCGRPIIGTPMRVGNAGEPYHVECTLSPYAQPEITTDTTSRDDAVGGDPTRSVVCSQGAAPDAENIKEG